MDSAEGLCELVSVLCKLSDEMSLPLSAFFFSFVFFCLSALLFPSVRLSDSSFRLFVSSFCLPAFSFARAFSLSASPPAPPGDHSPSDQKRTLILDENARSFWTTNVPNRSAACPCPGGRGWKKQPETTLFPVLPPSPVWFRCCAADGQPYHHCHENRRPSVEVAGLEIERNIPFFSFRRRQRRRRPFGRLLTGCTGCFQLDGRSIGCQRSGPAGLVWST